MSLRSCLVSVPYIDLDLDLSDVSVSYIDLDLDLSDVSVSYIDLVRSDVSVLHRS